jgi:hypothetical protein
MLFAAAAAAVAATAATTQSRQDIFVPSARFPCFRQPVLVVTPNAVLAFAENRNVTSCAPAENVHAGRASLPGAGGSAPNEVGSLQLRRSTDNGTTWSPLQSVFVGNIDFYTAVHDAATDTTWLMLEHNTDGNSNKNSGAPTLVDRSSSGSSEGATAAANVVVVEVLQSLDHGETWATLAPLHLDLPEPFKGGAAIPTVGHGIQLQRPGAAHDGRLVLPFVCTNTSAPKPSGDAGTCPGCVPARV